MMISGCGDPVMMGGGHGDPVMTGGLGDPMMMMAWWFNDNDGLVVQ